MLPLSATATPLGYLRLASVAGPPSPEYAHLPLPATVVMMPAASTLRIRLLPEAFAVEGPLLLRGRPEALNDRYNLEFEDPNDPYVNAQNPGSAYAEEYLIPRGPNGERIWLQQSWRGLLTAPQFSRNLHWFEEIEEASSAACCELLHAIDRCTIPGDLNDCSEWQSNGTRVIKPQRYQGWIGLGVDLGSVTGGCRG